MTPKHNMARLDMSSLGTSKFHYDLSSPSPPASELYVDSSDEEDLPAFSNMRNLRSSIADLPDAKLRAILVKLADTNSRFRRAITKEVACARVGGDSSPLSTTSSPKRRKSKTGHRDIHAPYTPVQPPPQPLFHDGIVYHPGTRYLLFCYAVLARILTVLSCSGHLDEEVYEFLPRMPHKAVLSDMRIIKMWTCCDEDEWSPGCRRAASYISDNNKHDSPHDIGLTHDDDVFPDSDLERHCNETVHEALTPASADEL